MGRRENLGTRLIIEVFIKTELIIEGNQHKLSFDANVSSFSLAESPPRDLQITTYK